METTISCFPGHKTIPFLLACVLSALSPEGPAQSDPRDLRLAATLLWSESYTVGTAHGRSGLWITPPAKSSWKPLSAKSTKAFRVRPGLGFQESPWLWLAAGNLAWAVGSPWGAPPAMTGPTWASEVMDVLEEEGGTWLAWAGGTAFRKRGGHSWEERDRGLPSTFVSLLVRSPGPKGEILAGTEKGLALWDGRAGRFRPAGLRGVAVRSLLFQGGILYVGTLRHGVFRMKAGPEGKAEPFGLEGCSVEALAAWKDRLFAAAGKKGVCVRGIRPGRAGEEELGAWDTLRAWEAEASALALLPPPPGRREPVLFAGTMGRGVWKSGDGGRTWEPFGLEGGHVTSLLPVTLPPRAAPPLPPLPEGGSFESRKAAVRAWFLAKRRRSGPGANLYTLPWLLEEEDLRAPAERALARILADPRGDMFFQFPAVGAFYRCKNHLSPGLQALFRHALLSYPGYRGDTMNHLCMWHTALYLAAAAFPEAGREEWFTGRSSRENFAFAREYLYRWMDRVFRKGMMEFDSPHYMAFYVGPLLLLHDFAPEKEMRLAAEQTLDLILVDYAGDFFEGIYAGAHSREPKGRPFDMEWDYAAGLAYLYFGEGGRGEPRLGPVTALAAQSSYRCPKVIQEIALDRSRPVLRFEHKIVRNRWRYHGPDRTPPVFKVTYLAPAFAMGSCQGGILQPIQQHTWDASWRDDRGRARTLFTLHPYIGAYELATFFPEGPLRMLEIIARQKGSYLDEDKWVSASPWERIFQDRSSLAALYKIPDGEKASHADAYLPVPPRDLKKAGVWLALESGPVFAGLWCSGPLELSPAPREGARARCRARPCAFAVEISPRAKWKSFQAFLGALESRAPRFDPLRCSLEFKNLQGRTMQFTWPDGRFLDGKPWDYPRNALFQGPWIQSELDSRRIQLHHGKNTLLLKLPKAWFSL